jgi:hypothetical protein
MSSLNPPQGKAIFLPSIPQHSLINCKTEEFRLQSTDRMAVTREFFWLNENRNSAILESRKYFRSGALLMKRNSHMEVYP